MSSKYKIDRAENFTQDEIEFIKKTVLDGGEVDSGSFDKVIKKNPFLILYPSADTIKGVGALKVPIASYKNKVFQKSKTKRNPEEFEFELGWVVSLERGKGYGKALTKILSDYKNRLYATIRDGNPAMIHIIECSGFIKSGESYKSERGDYTVGLYIKG